MTRRLWRGCTSTDNLEVDPGGRIQVMWDESKFLLSKVAQSDQVIHFKAKCIDLDSDFRFSVVYGHNSVCGLQALNLIEVCLVLNTYFPKKKVGNPLIILSVGGEWSSVGHSLDRDRNQPHCTNCIMDRDRGTNRLHLFPASGSPETKKHTPTSA